MAATRLIALHVNKGKTIAQTLADRTDYSKNEKKTEGGKYISSYECDARTADEEFLLSKRQYEHMTGRRHEHNVIAYQIRQSFKPGEVTPEEANRIGYELGMRFTKGKHAFIVATHTDRAHIHNHIIFNSTALDCTRKFRNFFLSGLALQKVSDRLCLEHGLSIIEPRPYRERKKRTEYPKRTSNRDDLRAVIDTVLQKKPKDFEELISFLAEAGCEYKPGKRPSIRIKGQERFARFSSLGEGYTVDDLKDALAGKRIEEGLFPRGGIYSKYLEAHKSLWRELSVAMLLVSGAVRPNIGISCALSHWEGIVLLLAEAPRKESMRFLCYFNAYAPPPFKKGGPKLYEIPPFGGVFLHQNRQHRPGCLSLLGGIKYATNSKVPTEPDRQLRPVPAGRAERQHPKN